MLRTQTNKSYISECSIEKKKQDNLSSSSFSLYTCSNELVIIVSILFQKSISVKKWKDLLQIVQV